MEKAMVVGPPYLEINQIYTKGAGDKYWESETIDAGNVLHIKSVALIYKNTVSSEIFPLPLYIDRGSGYIVADLLNQPYVIAGSFYAPFMNHYDFYLTEGQRCKVKIPDLGADTVWNIIVVGEMNYLSNQVEVGD